MTTPDEIAASIRRSFLDFGGERMAAAVWEQRVCDRCARYALIAVALAVGFGPGDVAREAVRGYQRAMREITDAYVNLTEADVGPDS